VSAGDPSTDTRATDETAAIQVRVATAADIPEMHRIRLAVRENRLSNPDVVRPTDYVPMITEHGRGWVAEKEGRIAGFAIIDMARRNVWALFVGPEQEACGIGRRLHRAMLDWAFAAGAESVYLGTAPGTRAERFYRTAGWTYAGPEPNGESRFEMMRDQWRALASGPES
jgi:GNAT superfamily N-acetyltransferase